MLLIDSIRLLLSSPSIFIFARTSKSISLTSSFFSFFREASTSAKTELEERFNNSCAASNRTAGSSEFSFNFAIAAERYLLTELLILGFLSIKDSISTFFPVRASIP